MAAVNKFECLLVRQTPAFPGVFLRTFSRGFPGVFFGATSRALPGALSSRAFLCTFLCHISCRSQPRRVHAATLNPKTLSQKCQSYPYQACKKDHNNCHNFAPHRMKLHQNMHKPAPKVSPLKAQVLHKLSATMFAKQHQKLHHEMNQTVVPAQSRFCASFVLPFTGGFLLSSKNAYCLAAERKGLLLRQSHCGVLIWR